MTHLHANQTLGDRGIVSAKDLDGQRVSFWQGSFSSTFQAFFAANGVSPESIPQYYSVSLFLKRGVAACAAMEYNEYHRIWQSGIDADRITAFRMRDFGLGFPEDGLYATARWVSLNPELARAIRTATLAGWHYARAHPEEAIDAVLAEAQLAGVPANRPHERWMLDAKLGPLQGLVRGIALALETQELNLSFDQLRAMQNAALRDYPEIYGTAVALLPAMKPDAWPNAALWAYRGQGAIHYRNLDDEDHPYIGKDWFALPRYLDQGVWSEPYRWENGIKMVTYSMPIHRRTAAGAVFVGVVDCAIDLDWLDGLLAELPLGEQGYGLLMTRNGIYISHPTKAFALNESVFSVAEARGSEALRKTGQGLVSGLPGIVPWSSWRDGADTWLAWQPLKTADWTMGTVVQCIRQLQGLYRRPDQRYSWICRRRGAIG